MANIFTFVFVTLIALNSIVLDAREQNILLVQQNLDPLQERQLSINAFENDVTRGDREKRLGPITKIGITASLLDLVFGKLDSFIDSKTRLINELDKQNIIKNEKYFGITVPPPTPPGNNLRPTDPPPVEFDINSAVSFVIPDRLYGSSFTLVTNASKILGDVIYNTADRAQELADRVNSRLKNKFGFAKKIISIKNNFHGHSFSPEDNSIVNPNGTAPT